MSSGSGGDYYLKTYMHSENLHISIYCSFIPNCQNLDTTIAVVHSLSRVRLFVTPWPGAHEASPSFTISQGLLKLMSSRWCHPTISSSVVPFSSCPQSFPASGSFPKSQLFTSGGQSTGASTSASDLPMSIQDWSPLVLTGLISLQPRGLSRFFSNTTV